MRTLLAEGAYVDDRAGGGQTALMLAAIFGHVEIVRLLIVAGADVHMQDNLGLTAKEWAARRGYSEIAQLLSNVSPGEVRSSPRSASSELRSNGANEQNPQAEAKTPFEQNAHSATEEQPRIIPAGQNDQHREHLASATEPTFAEQDDGLRWIKFQKRLIADDERRKAQEELLETPSEMRTDSLNDALGATDEQMRSLTEQGLREEEQEHWESLIELKISPEQDGPTATDEHQRTKLQPKPRIGEQERPAATQSPAISPGLEQLRILEESPKGVEAEVFSKPPELALAATEPDEGTANGKARKSWPGLSGGLPDPSEVNVNEAERYTKQEGTLAEESSGPARLTKTSESNNATPVKRCPRCDITFGDALLSYCAYDGTKLVSANFTAARDRISLTLWALVAVMAVLGGLLGYQINNYLAQERGSSAPPAAQSEQPANPSKDLPTIQGALSGMEIDLPEPEYPEQARIEGVTGTVSVRVQVNKNGRVVSARSSRGDWRLRASAIKAAQRATFSVEKLAGRGASGTITYVFK